MKIMAKTFAVALTAFMVNSLGAQGVFDFENYVFFVDDDFNTSTHNSDIATTSTYGWSNGWTGSGNTWSTSNSADSSSYMHLTASGAWSGAVISSSSGSGVSDYNSDLYSVSGGGAKGSSSFAVMKFGNMEATTYSSVDAQISTNTSTFYNPSDWTQSEVRDTTDAFSFIFDNAYKVESIDVNLTAYTYTALMTPTENANVGKKDLTTYKTLSNTDGFYYLRINALNGSYEVDTTVAPVDVLLAKGEGGEVTIVVDWTTVDLSSLNGADGTVNGLYFSVIASNDFDSYGSTLIPTYVAVDNVVVPEPASVAALLGAFALGFAAYMRRRTK